MIVLIRYVSASGLDSDWSTSLSRPYGNLPADLGMFSNLPGICKLFGEPQVPAYESQSEVIVGGV